MPPAASSSLRDHWKPLGQKPTGWMKRPSWPSCDVAAMRSIKGLEPWPELESAAFSTSRQKRPRIEAKVPGELGDLSAVELAFVGQDFGNRRFGNPGAGRGLGLGDTLVVDQEAEQLRIADRAHGNGLGLVGLD